jgi:transcriptional regulator with XRE-family HTH domain
VPKESALAQFLRNRRAQLQPADVGLPSGARRRVVGLRREEVAKLAEVSVEYYLRIEQGRETNPSDQVLDGIARALRLDDDTAAYLRDLVRQPRCSNRHPPKDLNPAIHSLIDSWPLTPAHIHDRALTVVSANPIARAVFPSFSPGTNILRSLFVDPDLREFYRDWEKLTVWAVRWVRVYSAHTPDPGLATVIDELITESKLFRMLWSCTDVRHDNSGKTDLIHPLVGPLTLDFQHMVLGSGHVLVVYWADPGSASERTLRQLSGA